MARYVANVDIITDSFEIWLLETNELLNALSTEIITANATYANTGNTTIPRTGQLYGTFGANNLVVSNWLKGGNVNGSFANLYISTNTNISNTTVANLNLMVSNSTSFSYVNPVGGYFGNTTANSFINSIAIITQSNSIVNTNISPTLVQVANSSTTANVTAGSFKTGIFQANTTEVQVGANVIANATAFYVGNSTVNSVHSQAQTLLQNSIHAVTVTQENVLIGNSTINALANSTLITIANSTSSANINPISFNTGLFVGNTTAVAVGANVIANATALYIGNSTVNTVATQTTTTIANSTVSAVISISTAAFGNSTVNTQISQTLFTAANSTVSANVTVAGFNTGIFAANQTTVSVGANVIANATSLYVGNSTINSVFTQTTTTVANGTHNATIGVSYSSFGNSTANTTTSQTLIQAANSTVTANVTTAGFQTGIFSANQTTVAVGANVIANSTSLYVGNSTINVVYGFGTIAASANLGITAGYLNVTGAVAVSSNVALSNTLVVTGNTTLSNTLTVAGNTTLSSALAVTGAASFSNIVTFRSDYIVDVAANADVGSTIGPVLLYRFPKATYASAKFEVQIKNGNTQLSELVLAHDGGSSAYVTTYGTVASNGGASPLGTFTANTDTANVNLYLVQTVANSAVKVIAHLIK